MIRGCAKEKVGVDKFEQNFMNDFSSSSELFATTSFISAILA
jgi:hypothetical protein